MESEAHTHLFNMCRSTSGGEELSESVLDCFTVGGAGGYSVPGFHLENFIRGGSIMKGGHDQMKSRCGFYSKLEYCEGVVEEFGGEVGVLGGKLPPRSPQ